MVIVDAVMTETTRYVHTRAVGGCCKYCMSVLDEGWKQNFVIPNDNTVSGGRLTCIYFDFEAF